MRDVLLNGAHYAAAAKNGVSASRLYQRVHYGRFTIEEAINTPVQKQRRGVWAKWGEIATSNGIKSSTFYDRLRNGWSEERAATTPKKVKTGEPQNAQ